MSARAKRPGAAASRPQDSDANAVRSAKPMAAPSVERTTPAGLIPVAKRARASPLSTSAAAANAHPMGGAASNVVSSPTAKRARAKGNATRIGTSGATTQGRTRTAPATTATPRIARAAQPVARAARRATTLPPRKGRENRATPLTLHGPKGEPREGGEKKGKTRGPLPILLCRASRERVRLRGKRLGSACTRPRETAPGRASLARQ
jgi:hypothetical protein